MSASGAKRGEVLGNVSTVRLFQMWRNGVVQARFQQRKCGGEPPAERYFQRRIVAFCLSPGEFFTTVGQYGEISVGVKGNGK